MANLKNKLSSKTLDILKQFVDKNGGLIMYFINPYGTIKESLGGQVPRLYYTLANLKRRGYLKTKKIKNKNYYSLTKKGQHRLSIFLLNENVKKVKWDKKWRILIFDIPESKRSYRANTRRVLKEIGFYRLQNSVWVYPYDIIDYLYYLLPGFREGDWFEYIEANKISSQNKIKKYFNLK